MPNIFLPSFFCVKSYDHNFKQHLTNMDITSDCQELCPTETRTEIQLDGEHLL